MSKKINKVGYKCIPGGNPSSRPILMKDGKVIDQDATVIEDKIIADSMRYISKMTKGLATGVLSHDPEYIELQDKVLGELISKKLAEVKKEIEVTSKRILRDYADAHKAQDRALAKMQAVSAKSAKSDGYSFYVGEDNNIYKSYVPGGTPLFGKGCPAWTRLNIGDLKKDIDDRRAKSKLQKVVIKEAKEKGYFTGSKPWMGQPDQLWIDDPEQWLLEMKKKDDVDKEKRIKILANKIVGATTKKKKKKTKKKTIKKVVAKKKIVKAKKRDRK